MPRFTEFFVREHRRLQALLTGCLPADGTVDLAAFDVFRRALLQNVAREERVLLPALEARLPRPPRWRRHVHEDHAALVMLCVPTPHREWLEGLSERLTYHHALERQPDGFAALCDTHLEAQVLRQARALPALTLPPLADDWREVPRRLDRVLRDTGLRGGVPP